MVEDLLPVILVVGYYLVVGLLLDGGPVGDVLNEVRLVNGVAEALLPTHYALIVQQAARGQRSPVTQQARNTRKKDAYHYNNVRSEDEESKKHY